MELALINVCCLRDAAKVEKRVQSFFPGKKVTIELEEEDGPEIYRVYVRERSMDDEMDEDMVDSGAASKRLPGN